MTKYAHISNLIIIGQHLGCRILNIRYTTETQPKTTFRTKGISKMINPKKLNTNILLIRDIRVIHVYVRK